MRQKRIEAGKIRNTHALRGEVKAECYLEGDNPFSKLRILYLSSEKEDHCLEILSSRRHGEVFLLTFRGIDSVEAASALKGKTVFAAREELDPDGTKVFFTDLIGTDLTDADTGEKLGQICAVLDRGAGELFLIRLPDQRECYFPYVREWIECMDAEKGVSVRAPKGIFD